MVEISTQPIDIDPPYRHAQLVNPVSETAPSEISQLSNKPPTFEVFDCGDHYNIHMARMRGDNHIDSIKVFPKTSVTTQLFGSMVERKP
jgi:hypothetical protein